MKKSIVLSLVFSAIILSTSGCGFLTKSQYYRDEMVNQVNRVIPMIQVVQTSAEMVYEAEQREVVALAFAEKTSKEEVENRVNKVREKWAPLWAKFDLIREYNTELKSLVDKTDQASQLLALSKMGSMVELEKQAIELFTALKGKRK